MLKKAVTVVTDKNSILKMAYLCGFLALPFSYKSGYLYGIKR